MKYYTAYWEAPLVNGRALRTPWTTKRWHRSNLWKQSSKRRKMSISQRGAKPTRTLLKTTRGPRVLRAIDTKGPKNGDPRVLPPLDNNLTFI